MGSPACLMSLFSGVLHVSVDMPVSESELVAMRVESVRAREWLSEVWGEPVSEPIDGPCDWFVWVG